MIFIAMYRYATFRRCIASFLLLVLVGSTLPRELWHHCERQHTAQVASTSQKHVSIQAALPACAVCEAQLVPLAATTVATRVPMPAAPEQTNAPVQSYGFLLTDTSHRGPSRAPPSPVG